MRVVDRRIRTVARAVRYPTWGSLHPPRQHAGPEDEVHKWRHHHRREAIRAAVRVLEALDGDVITTYTATLDNYGWDWEEHGDQWEGIFRRDRDPDGTYWLGEIALGMPGTQHSPEPDLDRVQVTVRRLP